MLKIRRPLGRLIFNMVIAIPGKTVFLIETAPWNSLNVYQALFHCNQFFKNCYSSAFRRHRHNASDCPFIHPFVHLSQFCSFLHFLTNRSGDWSQIMLDTFIMLRLISVVSWLMICKAIFMHLHANTQLIFMADLSVPVIYGCERA